MQENSLKYTDPAAAGVDIKPLDGVGFDVVCDAFLEAFKDYGMDFDRGRLAAMLRRRGADPALSFGAIVGGRPVSFVLNGIGMHGGKLTAYDTGTGTVPAFRGRGLTDALLRHALPELRRAGVEQYLLEVLQDNAPAVKIYARQGFEIVREFNCYAAPREALAAVGKPAADVEISRVAADAVAAMQEWLDFEPSWQNSMDSIARAGEACVCLEAYDGPEPVGFGVAEAAYGDVAQIAVRPGYRRRGVGSRLMAALAACCPTESLRVVNVAADCESLNAFLQAAGFGLSCRQYEMVREIL